MDTSPRRDAAGTGRQGALLPRRRMLGLLGVGLAAIGLAGCDSDPKWNSIDISGSLPALQFTMTRARDGKDVTAADYKGRVVLLYFGYTFCPDICPATLSNVAAVFDKLGKSAQHVRMLFVTIDPNRDSLTVLKHYVGGFGAEFVGLRGTPDEIATLARRYRVAYSVEPATKSHPYEVTHSSAVYVFDSTGAARLIMPSLVDTKSVPAATADLHRLIDEAHPPGLMARLLHMV